MATPADIKNNKEKDKKKRRFVFLWWFWIVGVLLLCIPFFLFFLISIGTFGELPDTKLLENPKQPVATEIYSADGVVIGKYYDANRSPVDYEDLSPHLVDALISTEDVRFRDHAGIDFRRAITIIPYNLIGKKQGASTISQQLAKNLFPRKKMSTPELVIQKLKEWVLATRLERLYTKDEILAMYLNTVEFTNGAFGIKSASNIYFNKSPDKLSVNEAAMIVGMLQNPSLNNPIRHPQKTQERRNVVLAQMVKNDKLTELEAEKLKLKPLGLDYTPETHTQGLATYFREYIRNILKDWADENGRDLYRDGLKIYTTIDSRMQQYAEDAVMQHMRAKQAAFFRELKATNRKPWADAPEVITLTMKRSERYRAMKDDGATEAEIKKAFGKPRKMKVFSYRGGVDTVMSPLDSIKYYKYYLQPGFATMEPGTGHIKSWVGGIDFKYFKYDHCAPYAKRQVGSTFKPFVYAAAIEAGYSPCQKAPNVDVIFEKYDNWNPQNSEKWKDGEMMTLQQGLAASVNKITAWTIKQVGIEPVIDMARNLGITSKLDPVPSISLGVADVSLFEMLPAYNTFNNGGMYVEPVLITKIVDKNGTVLKEFVPSNHMVLDEKKNYLMLNMLKGTTNCKLYGTACRLRYKHHIMGPMAGKTGTTQKNADGWFMGLIPQLTGGMWVGGEDPSIHFQSMAEGQGSEAALPIWAYFLKKVYADKTLGFDPNRDWVRPAGEMMEMDCSKYEDPNGMPEEVRPPTDL